MHGRCPSFHHSTVSHNAAHAHVTCICFNQLRFSLSVLPQGLALQLPVNNLTQLMLLLAPDSYSQSIQGVLMQLHVMLASGTTRLGSLLTSSRMHILYHLFFVV